MYLDKLWNVRDGHFFCCFRVGEDIEEGIGSFHPKSLRA